MSMSHDSFQVEVGGVRFTQVETQIERISAVCPDQLYGANKSDNPRPSVRSECLSAVLASSWGGHESLGQRKLRAVVDFGASVRQ